MPLQPQSSESSIPDWPTTLTNLDLATTTQDSALLNSTLRTWYCTPRPSDTPFLATLRARTSTSFDRQIPIAEITRAWNSAWDRQNLELEEQYQELQLQQSAWRKKGARKRERESVRDAAEKSRLYEVTTRWCSRDECENKVIGILGRAEDSVELCGACRGLSSTLTRRENDYYEWMGAWCSKECRNAHEHDHQKECHACGAAERCTNQLHVPITTSSTQQPVGYYCKYCWEDYRKPTFFCNIRCQAAAQAEHGQRVTPTHDRIQAQAFIELDEETTSPPSRAKAVKDFQKWLKGWMSDEEFDAYRPKLEGLTKGVPWLEVDQS